MNYHGEQLQSCGASPLSDRYAIARRMNCHKGESTASSQPIGASDNAIVQTGGGTVLSNVGQYLGTLNVGRDINMQSGATEIASVATEALKTMADTKAGVSPTENKTAAYIAIGAIALAGLYVVSKGK